MGFYKSWLNKISKKDNDDNEILIFLEHGDDVISPFIDGEEEELEAFWLSVNSHSVSDFVSQLEHMTVSNSFSSNDVPCFSTFEIGATRVPELLEFSPSGLSFKELGYKLKKPLQKTASQKYGENQARLAEMLHLVTINDSAPKRVFVTRLGKYLNRYSFLEKENVIRSLLLQDPYIQHVVTATLHYSYNYSEVLTVLSRSTAMRRRQNVRKIVTFILSDEEFSDCLNHIDWEV